MTLTVGLHSPKISPLPNPSHSGLGDQISASLVRILLIFSGAVTVDSTPEMMFLGRIRIVYDIKNTLTTSSTPEEGVRGACIIDNWLHFACVSAHFAVKFNRISYKNVEHFLIKTECDGFLAKIERQDGSYLHKLHRIDHRNDVFVDIDEDPRAQNSDFFMENAFYRATLSVA